MRLILVRHCESQWNEEGRIQGFSDPELNETGKEQAERVAQALRGEKINAVYSSPLKRAVETARAIAQKHQLEVKVDPALKEIDTGELEGLTLEELRRLYGDFLKEWKEGRGSLRMPGGESLEELQRRAWGAIQRIVQTHSDGAVVVVSHTFTNLIILCSALNMDLSSFRRFKQDVAAINILHFGERGAALLLLNDTCHLGDRKSG
jgi:broad specificity phosphatase PhoE